MRWWLLYIDVWAVRFIKAEAPCWKGEIQIGPFLLKSLEVERAGQGEGQ